jgi:GT2 family glycosyltransferase/glycosyltransferase involved in cell wall biosynthesis
LSSLKRQLDLLNSAFKQSAPEEAPALTETKLQQEASARERKLAELSAEVESLRKALQAREIELSKQKAALSRAEEIRKLTLSRCHQFQTRLEEQLQVYRQQRAWRVMLWCRKVYALAFAPHRAGKGNLLRFAISTLAGRPSLNDQELSFPSLPRYLPKQFMEPFEPLGPGASSYAVTSVIGSDSDLPVLPRPRKYDIIVLAIIDFDFRFQRPQQLAVRFAREGHRVFWVSPTRYLPSSSSRPYDLLELDENLWEIHLRGQQSDIYMGSLDDTTARQLVDALTQLYQDCGIVENCALVQLPFWRQVALGLRSAFGTTILYDCMDDWETFPSFGPFNIAEERLLASEADVLLATAQNLVEKFERRGAAPQLVRNAADFEFFSKDDGRDRVLRGVRRPIVGYFGAIADWLDLDLVYQVAQSRPRYSFVLIGDVFDHDTSRLQSLPNVHLLGHKEYSEIPHYLREFDVCIIPFLVNDVTNATDPVKLYEYFSQGKPVVATAMAELLPRGDLIYISRDAGEFANNIDQALVEDADQMRPRRINFAASNTWTHRYAAIDAEIRKVFPSVSIIIVTHNSRNFLGPCLDSVLRNTTCPNFDIILVDNASQDDTPSLVNRYASTCKHVQGFCLSENLGFAAGNNIGVNHSTADYIVFLNADTLVTAGWLEILIRHHRKDAAIGLLTAVTNFAGNEIKINVDYENQADMEQFAAYLNRAYFGKAFDVAAAPLYCALMPRRVWNIVGELDESFGIGMFEDDDLSMRVRQAGFRVVAAEDCFIHHFGQGSFSKLTSGQYERTFEKNRRLYEQKWRTTWKAHQLRSGVRPVREDSRFDPALFCKPRD